MFTYKNYIKLPAIFVMMLILSCNTWSGISYDGSSTIGEKIMLEIAGEIKEKEGVKIDHIGLSGSGEGINALLSGKINLTGISRTLTDEEKAQKLYYKIIAYDGIAVFLNEDNPIDNLSRQEIKDIFTGKIKNWKELGGKDVEILVVTEIIKDVRATIKEFQKGIMDGENFCKTKEINKPRDCVEYVAGNKNSITHASMAFNMKGVKIISIDHVHLTNENIKSGAYHLSRPLILITKNFPEGDMKKVFDFVLSPAGQKIISRNFVPVVQGLPR